MSGWGRGPTIGMIAGRGSSKPGSGEASAGRSWGDTGCAHARVGDADGAHGRAGRLSHVAENEDGATGRLTDPRSYCIQTTLQAIAHGGSIDQSFIFTGYNADRFASAPFSSNGVIPTVK